MRRLISFNVTPNSSRHQLEQLPNHNFPSLGIIPVIEGGTRVILSRFCQLTFHLQSWQTGPKHIFSAKNLKFEDKVQEALKSNYVKSKGLKEKAEFLVLRFSKLSCIMAPLLQEALFSSHFFKSYDTQLPSNKLLAYVVQNCLYMCNQKYLQSKYISLKENCIRNATCEMSKLISIIFRQTDCPYNQ